MTRLLRALPLTAAFAMTFAGPAIIGPMTAAWAGKPPELSNPAVIDHVSTKAAIPFQISYKDQEQDPPLEAGVELITPDQGKVTLKFPEKDYASAVGDHAEPLVMTFTPTTPGTYRYHFYARDVDGRSLFPDDGSYLEFQVRPDWLPWAEIGIGFIISFLIITFVIYQLLHKLMRSSQTLSARVALMVGAVCWMLTILLAENWLTNWMAWGAVGLVTVLLLVVTIATK